MSKPSFKSRAVFSLATAISTASAAIAAGFLLSGCQCQNPDGCSPTPVPKLTINVDVPAGTYSAQQSVTITSPNAESIHYSRDDSLPSATDCANYDGSPVVITDNTILRVRAVGDDVNYKTNSATFKYLITNPTYTNRHALNDWLAYEQQALQAFYCAYNDCVQPPAESLLAEINWLLVCDNGYASYQNDPAMFTSTFTYQNCQLGDTTVNGQVQLVLNADALPAIDIAASGTVTVTKTSYSATIEDHTKRTYRLSGAEGTRQGHYLASCAGNGCLTESVQYWYDGGTLWINDPQNPDICAQRPQ